jgi:uncharacterized protein YcgL (UPF0745 family)
LTLLVQQQISDPFRMTRFKMIHTRQSFNCLCDVLPRSLGQPTHCLILSGTKELSSPEFRRLKKDGKNLGFFVVIVKYLNKSPLKQKKKKREREKT